MPGGTQDDVGRIAGRARELVAFQKPIIFHVTDYGLNAVPSSHLAPYGRRGDAPRVADGDIEAFTLDPVADIAAVDIGTLDLNTGESGSLIDLCGQAVAVIRIARQGHGTQNKLPTGGAFVGRCNGSLDAELVPGARLALADAL